MVWQPVKWFRWNYFEEIKGLFSNMSVYLHDIPLPQAQQLLPREHASGMRCQHVEQPEFAGCKIHAVTGDGDLMSVDVHHKITVHETLRHRS